MTEPNVNRQVRSIVAYWAARGVTIKAWAEWVEGPISDKHSGFWTVKTEGIPLRGEHAPE